MTETPVRQTDDSYLANLVEELSQKLIADSSTDIEAFLDGHPGEAERLRLLIPTLRILADVGLSRAAESSSSGAPPASPTRELERHQILGDFRILGEVGRGGMGVVFEAEQISLRRRVALKVLPTISMLDPRTLQRFRNEAQAAASLHHTHVVPIYGAGSERGVHYYAMQFIDGLTLAEIIQKLRGSAATVDDRNGRRELPARTETTSVDAGTDRRVAAETEVMARLTTEKASGSDSWFRHIGRRMAQVADALHHAHELGVTHRDIKPANLMLDRLGCIWVTDFGLARVDGADSLTMTGDLLGTLRYMSPEQALAKRIGVDHRSDIYSLGVNRMGTQHVRWCCTASA